MEQYLDHSAKILSDSYSGYKPNRTGVDSISRFGHQNEYDLQKGFPLLTTKKMNLETISKELLWFMHGDTNIRTLVNEGVHIWDDNAFDYYLKKINMQDKYEKYSDDWKKTKSEYIYRISTDEEFAMRFGDLGNVYGAQWRRWKSDEGNIIDQFGDLIDMLQNKSSSRRMIVTAWNPGEIPSMALPPCHVMYHTNVLNGKLDLQLYQRSCDMFLGVPFNIASYALLTHILAKETGLEVGRFIHSFGDAHFYCGKGERGKFWGKNFDEFRRRIKGFEIEGDRIGNRRYDLYLEENERLKKILPKEDDDYIGQDHVTAIIEQLGREPRDLPQIEIENKPLDELKSSDIKLKGYDPHPFIKRSMAV